MGQTQKNWWEQRHTGIALMLLATVPLLWPTVPPLVDLPGHIGRYRVQLDGANSALRQFYDFKWALIGNLGIDLLIIPVSAVFGLELGVKLIVLTIPALTVGALLWIAREVHGRIPPTALFALPLAYGHPFLFGFVNFSLAMALALLAFALWLRMARLGATRWRPYVFFPISIVLWVCHAFGWGTLGVLAFSAELIRQHDQGTRWPRAFVNAAAHCLPMAFPLVLMVAWRSDAVPGQTGDWFNWNAKILWLNMTLRDRWRPLDAASVFVLAMLLFFALRDRRLAFSRNLGVSALVLLAVFLMLPRIIFGSAYADMRLTPFLMAIAIVAIRPSAHASTRFLGVLALSGIAFFGVRIAATTASLGIVSARYDRALAALDHVPVGARLVWFTQHSCGMVWSTNRMEHLGAMAMARKRAFSNDQWDVPGAQVVTIAKSDAAGFVSDPSQIVVTEPCGIARQTLDRSLVRLPRDAFDYVWLIDPPAYDARLTTGLTPLWRDGRDVLFRIDRQ